MSAVRAIYRRYRRALRVALVVLALLVYLGSDAIALSARETVPNWGLRVNAHGVITWVDPNGPADGASLQVGDRLLRPAGVPGTYANLARRATLLVERHGLARPTTLHAAPAFGPTRSGQALVLIGVLLLLVGGLAWAYGRGGRTPALLALLTAAAAFAFLGQAWGFDGRPWALRLAFVAGSVFLPVAWAAFFLSFPYDRLALRRWRRVFVALAALALGTVVAYALSLWIGLPPYPLVRICSLFVFFFGLILGPVALAKGGPAERAWVRQQRRILMLSTVGAIVPALLLSFAPLVLLGHVAVPFQVTALAMVLLPLGLAYAIVRYNLMEMDVVVRRGVAAALGGFFLITLTSAVTLALHPLVPSLDLLALVVAVLAGALGGRYAWHLSRRIVERLLSPELMRSHRLLAQLDALLLRGEEDLESIGAHLERAACTATGAAWASLLVRRRVPGAIFCRPHKGAAHAALPRLAAALSTQPWGVTPGDGRGPVAPDEWRALSRALGAEPALLIPIRLRGEVIAVLGVAERDGGDRLSGPDREALALLMVHAALAVDHARVRAEMEAERTDAAALSTASMQLAGALDDPATLPCHIVGAISGLRDLRGVALLLSRPDGTLSVAAQHGAMETIAPPPDPAAVLFQSSPVPYAWLPLAAGETLIGALCLRWSDEHVIVDHDRRLLTIYASGAAMALEHARLYERARIQAERDPVTDLYNHRAFHGHLEVALERARATGGSVSMLLIDVADFKLFNDTHGHQAGDRALRRVAEVLQSCCHTSDAAARLGGDEFAVLLPDASIDAAYTVAERITDLAAASALVSPEGRQLPVRLTIGAAAFPSDADAANALLARADERMYAAKRSGVTIAATRTGADEAGRAPGGDQFGILEALVEMVDNRDRYTAEHSEQVATYAYAIAAELGLSPETIKTLRLAGLLHDVGKIGVPDRILRKPDKLTDEEYDIMRRHVELSEALLSVVTSDRDLMDAVRYHHERWDGRGYPYRLAGEAVPLLGRIMIVADAVSAMGMDRPYRKGLPWVEIAVELVRGSGTQFDPELVAPALTALHPHFSRASAA